MIARILIPLQSRPDPQSLRRELDGTFPLPSEIHLLHVLAEPLLESSVDPGQLLDREREARAFLEEAGRALWPARIRTWLRRGDPAEEICLAAAELQAELIALPGFPTGEGQPSKKRGPVAREVLRRSEQPVLAPGLVPGTPGPSRRILFLEGEVSWTERALGLLQSMTLSPLAEVVILELAIPILLPQSPSILSGVIPVPQASVPQAQTAPVETLRHSGLPARCVTLRERAVPAVERMALELGSDLILLPRGRTSSLMGGFLSPREVARLYRRVGARILLLPA
jgi:nucleotide-binding universal stress UspA family protein